MRLDLVSFSNEYSRDFAICISILTFVLEKRSLRALVGNYDEYSNNPECSA